LFPGPSANPDTGGGSRFFRAWEWAIKKPGGTKRFASPRFNSPENGEVFAGRGPFFPGRGGRGGRACPIGGGLATAPGLSQS